MTKSRLEKIILTMLAIGPLAFLAVLTIARTGGSSYSALFRNGLVGFLGVGILLAAAGAWRRRRPWLLGGSTTLLFVLVSGFFGGSGMWWVGSKTIELVVVVKDNETNQPIPRASVRFSGADLASKATTDGEGRVRLSHEFMTHGTLSPVQDTGSIQLFRGILEVEAEGYHSAKEGLDSLIEPVWDLYGPPLPTVEIRLRKERRP